MRRSFAIIAIAALVLMPASARAEAWRLTLEQAVVRALEANRDIAMARERLAELDGLKGEARSQGLPQLAGTASYQRTWRKPELIINGQPVSIGMNNTYTTGAALSQLLWDGGRVFKAIRAAKAEEARGIETIRDAEEQVRFEVKRTFYQILYTDRVIEVLNRQLRQLQGHLVAIRERFGQGLESDYALMRQQVEVANLEPQLIDARRVRELLVNGMKILLVIPPEDEFSPEGGFGYRSTALPPVSELLARARGARPDLNAERFRIKSLEQNVGVEKAGWWPQLSFTSAFQWQGFSDDLQISAGEHTHYYTSGLALSWPIFDGLRTASRVRQAKAKLLRQSYLASQKEDEVLRDAKDAHEMLLKAREALQSQLKSHQLARRASAIAGERFRSGLMSQIELNDTITAQAKAEELYLQATFECLTAEAALERAVGGER